MQTPSDLYGEIHSHYTLLFCCFLTKNYFEVYSGSTRGFIKCYYSVSADKFVMY